MFYVYLILTICASIDLLVLFITFLIFLIKFEENIFECYWSESHFESVTLSLLLLFIFPFTIYVCCSMLREDFRIEKREKEKKKEKTPWWKLKEFGGKV